LIFPLNVFQITEFILLDAEICSSFMISSTVICLVLH
jgi:hypothetical protein